MITNRETVLQILKDMTESETYDPAYRTCALIQPLTIQQSTRKSNKALHWILLFFIGCCLLFPVLSAAALRRFDILFDNAAISTAAPKTIINEAGFGAHFELRFPHQSILK